MQWLEWSDEAFERAKKRGCPVFLFVKAAWCRWCRELEQVVLADEAVCELLERDFVPVLVDKDRRPDIDARYTKGGWPTLAYLDDSGELLAADNYQERDELLARLRLVSEYYGQNREAVRQRLVDEARARRTPQTEPSRPALAALGRPKVELSLEVVEHVTRTILQTADPVHGGWGSQHKFPHPEAIDFALVRWSQTGDPELLQLVRRTLRNMQDGEIHDRVEGGFYRYATRPDWSVPHHEKMLDSNAQRLFAYLDAYQALGEDSFRATAEGVLRWMTSTLLDPETQAFRGSQDADPTYARLASPEARQRHGAPPCDPTVFSNWNAMAVSALFKAATVLGDEGWSRRGLATLDFLVRELFDDGVGVYHYWDGAPHLPGMLGDQAYTLRALVDAVQFAGANRFLPTAERLANLSIEHLRSESGGFYDTRHDPRATGGLRRRNRSILENSVMAEALLRLSHLARDKDYEDAGREALASFVTDYKRYGHFVAGYARAVDLLFHEPVHVTIVGSQRAPRTAELARAALRPYFASRIVQTLDPELDRALLERFELPAHGDAPRAYVHRGRESYAETDDPVRLPALMTRTERSGGDYSAPPTP